MNNPFTEHPNAYGQTYIQHFKFAFSCGTQMVFVGLACITHAFLPFFFTYTGSRFIFLLYEKFLEKRNFTPLGAAKKQELYPLPRGKS